MSSLCDTSNYSEISPGSNQLVGGVSMIARVDLSFVTVLPESTECCLRCDQVKCDAASTLVPPAQQH
jgi:hypothetical protein